VSVAVDVTGRRRGLALEEGIERPLGKLGACGFAALVERSLATEAVVDARQGDAARIGRGELVSEVVERVRGDAAIRVSVLLLATAQVILETPDIAGPIRRGRNLVASRIGESRLVGSSGERVA